MTNNNEEVEMDKIERIVEGLKKMRTLDSQEVEAVLSNGTLLSDWLRTTLTTYGADQYKKGVEEERSKSTAMVEIAKKHIIQKHLQHIPLDDEEWMKGKSKVECVNEVYQWVIDYLTQHHDTHR